MAARYFINGGVDNNWGTSGNWSTTSGGGGGAGVPTSSDDVHFDANSPNCTVNTSGRSALSLDFTGYAATITMSQTISVSGNITFGASGYTIAGSSAILGIQTGTHTSNGFVVPNFGLRGNSVTHTLADNFTVTNFLAGTTTGSTTINGNQITVNGNLDFSSCTTATILGTTTIVMGGNSTVGPYGSSSWVLRNNLTFNATTITWTTGTFRYNTGTMTHTAGTHSNLNNVDLQLILSTTLNCTSAMVWKSITLQGNTQTFTLSSDLYCVDLLPQGSAATGSTINGAFKIYVSGNITITTTTGGNYTGTLTEVVLTGACSFTWASITTGVWLFPTRINSSGAITIGTGIRVDLSKWVLQAAASVTTSEAWTLGSSSTFAPMICE